MSEFDGAVAGYSVMAEADAKKRSVALHKLHHVFATHLGQRVSVEVNQQIEQTDEEKSIDAKL